MDSLMKDPIDHVTTVPELWAQWHACYARDDTEFVNERGMSAEQAQFLLALVHSYDEDGPQVNTVFTSYSNPLSERELWSLWAAFHGRNDEEFVSDGIRRWCLHGSRPTAGILEVVHRFDEQQRTDPPQKRQEVQQHREPEEHRFGRWHRSLSF